MEGASLARRFAQTAGEVNRSIQGKHLPISDKLTDMSALHLDKPRLNIYGKAIDSSVIAGVVTPFIGGSTATSVGFFGLAVVIVAVAMRRNARSKRERRKPDTDSKTSDTEKKAKAEVGGATGDA